MRTNDIKKGTRIRLRNGWFGTMMDNMKGNTRVVDVEGDFREMGSVYSHDIVMAQNGPELVWDLVDHTPAQLKLKAWVDSQYASMGIGY